MLFPDRSWNRQSKEPGYVLLEPFNFDEQSRLDCSMDTVEMDNEQIDEEFFILRDWRLGQVHFCIQHPGELWARIEVLPDLTVPVSDSV